MTNQKMIITVHLNGPSRNVTPHVPYGPQEIADQAVECWRQGASVVHYHATDAATGASSTDVALFAEVERRIKDECDLITFPTLGFFDGEPSADERVAHIVEMAKDPATKPDCIPVDMLTTNLDIYDPERKTFTTGDHLYRNTTADLVQISERVRSVGVKPVSMIWSVSGVRLTEAFLDMGVFEDPLFCELVLFGDAFINFGHPATVKGLDALLDFFPPGVDWAWSVSAIGANPFAVLAAAIERGGHPIVGLHDYPYPELGLPTNAELVDRVVELGRSLGRDVATAAEAREMLNMK